MRSPSQAFSWNPIALAAFSAASLCWALPGRAQVALVENETQQPWYLNTEEPPIAASTSAAELLPHAEEEFDGEPSSLLAETEEIDPGVVFQTAQDVDDEDDEDEGEGGGFRLSGFPGNSQEKGIFGRVRADIGNLSAEIEGGSRTLGGELAYTDRPEEVGDVGFRTYLFNSRSPSGIFLNGGGEPEVQLENGHDVWIHRFGGGLELLSKLGATLDFTAGFSYQRASARRRAFSEVVAEDEFGNSLTFDDSGQDDLLGFNFELVQSKLDDREFPTRGLKWKLGADQTIPVGFGDINLSRFTGGFSQYIGLGESSTLLFNAQVGHVIGDLPPYEAFSLGGGNSVRGYRRGDLGTGRTFGFLSLEYRFPLPFTSLREIRLPIVKDLEIGTALFVDYGTDFNSGDSVRGRPASVRDKSGSGFGGGLGLRIDSNFGRGLLDFAVSDQGDFQVHFSLGERF